MGQQILLSINEFYAYSSGWVLAVIFALILIFIIKFTPAKTFFKAMIKKKPIAWVKYRPGVGEFLISDDTSPGSMEVKNLGYVHMTEGSQVREKRSKVTVYDVFAEYGASIPEQYAPLIQELREEGFKINTFKDYKHLVDLVSRPEYLDEYIQKLLNRINSHKKGMKKITSFLKKNTDDELRDEIRKARQDKENLKDLEIKILPYKTYKMHDLASMFPNNVSPVYVEAKVTNAVYQKMKKMRMGHQLLVYGAFACLVLIIGIVILLRVIQQPEPKVIIQTIQAANQSGLIF